MTNLTTTLQNATTRDERAKILQQELERRREPFRLGQRTVTYEQQNFGKVLDIPQYEGLQPGERVQYTTALGYSATGYVSHFFKSTTGQGVPVGDLVAMMVAREEGRPWRIANGVQVIVLNAEHGGYSRDHGMMGLPVKLE